ncbi:hypothetical protein AWC38_SpisGene2317 [Stylophora pistillata]|uniref:Uncharacterized protein n=1 Tax=Stylophora pistillata TaxID=50429 RepID=A0A2B4SVE8_STYPI|nr:hypothetical protein AWC38_SpisGene2317 [Stylophora pistillata]
MIMDLTMNVDGLEEMSRIGNENVQDRSTVNGDSYASRAAGTSDITSETRPPKILFPENSMHLRPKSAFFMTNKNTSARAVFDAFAESNVSQTDIQCLQRKLNGEVVVTFKSIAAKEQFLRLNSLNIDSEPFALQDIDKPLTFLTIYDAPFELSELAIIKRLTPYCEVIHYRRGKHSVANGAHREATSEFLSATQPQSNDLQLQYKDACANDEAFGTSTADHARNASQGSLGTKAKPDMAARPLGTSSPQKEKEKMKPKKPLMKHESTETTLFNCPVCCTGAMVNAVANIIVNS